MAAAVQGEPISQFNLAQCYLNGNGLPQDKTTSLYWLEESAERGNAKAQSFLGELYANGTYVELNVDEAVKWFINDGSDQPDYTEAVKWFLMAAEQGHIDSQYVLGVCYYHGKGVVADTEEAIKWYKKAADQGDDRSQAALGGIYYLASDNPKNYNEAKRWFEKAAEQGNVKAKEILSQMR